jgi:hypothetical protein
MADVNILTTMTPNFELEYYRLVLSYMTEKTLKEHLIQCGAFPQPIQHLNKDQLISLILNPENKFNKQFFIWGAAENAGIDLNNFNIFGSDLGMIANDFFGRMSNYNFGSGKGSMYPFGAPMPGSKWGGRGMPMFGGDMLGKLCPGLSYADVENDPSLSIKRLDIIKEKINKCSTDLQAADAQRRAESARLRRERPVDATFGATTPYERALGNLRNIGLRGQVPLQPVGQNIKLFDAAQRAFNSLVTQTKNYIARETDVQRRNGFTIILNILTGLRYRLSSPDFFLAANMVGTPESFLALISPFLRDIQVNMNQLLQRLTAFGDNTGDLPNNITPFLIKIVYTVLINSIGITGNRTTDDAAQATRLNFEDILRNPAQRAFNDIITDIEDFFQQPYSLIRVYPNIYGQQQPLQLPRQAAAQQPAAQPAAAAAAGVVPANPRGG